MQKNAITYYPEEVVNEDKYTKHFFAEDQRICSKLGGGFGTSSGLTTTTVTPISGTYTQMADRLASLNHDLANSSITNIDINIEQNLNSMIDADGTSTTESDLFFFHANLPMAIGIGARYYSSWDNVWLSVDPMSDKYPYQSPSCYAGLNPIMIIDLNGMWEENANGSWTAQKGDSWWSFHKDTGMSWGETKAYAKAYNAEKGRYNWKSVRVGDVAGKTTKEKFDADVASGKISVMKGPIPSSGECKQYNPDAPNIESSQKVKEVISLFGNMTNSINTTVKDNNSNTTIVTNSAGKPIGVSTGPSYLKVIVGSSGITFGTSYFSSGVSKDGGILLRISTPKINRSSYSTEISMNYKQAINSALAGAALILAKKKIPALIRTQRATSLKPALK